MPKLKRKSKVNYCIDSFYDLRKYGDPELFFYQTPYRFHAEKKKRLCC